MLANTSSPMNYTTLNTYLQTLLIDQAPSADYTTILPAAIQDAEQRIYRDMDFISTRSVQATTALTSGTREYTLPTTNVTFLVVQGISLITPYTSSFGVGKQNPLDEVSLDYIDSVFPDPSVQGLPSCWAMRDDAVIVVGQYPDLAYPVVITGTFRPSSMSATVTTSYIGNVYPDLLVAACMVFLTGYQRDFGAQSEQPQMSLSWEALYQSRLKSAMSEEQRRKGQGEGWKPFSMTPEATPPRT